MGRTQIRPEGHLEEEEEAGVAEVEGEAEEARPRRHNAASAEVCMQS